MIPYPDSYRESSLVPIVTPISGYVGKISIAKVAFAETGTSLFEVVDKVKFVSAIPADAKSVIKGAFYLLSAMKGGGEHGH